MLHDIVPRLKSLHPSSFFSLYNRRLSCSIHHHAFLILADLYHHILLSLSFFFYFVFLFLLDFPLIIFTIRIFFSLSSLAHIFTSFFFPLLFPLLSKPSDNILHSVFFFLVRSYPHTSIIFLSFSLFTTTRFIFLVFHFFLLLFLINWYLRSNDHHYVCLFFIVLYLHIHSFLFVFLFFSEFFPTMCTISFVPCHPYPSFFLLS